MPYDKRVIKTKERDQMKIKCIYCINLRCSVVLCSQDTLWLKYPETTPWWTWGPSHYNDVVLPV